MSVRVCHLRVWASVGVGVALFIGVVVGTSCLLPHDEAGWLEDLEVLEAQLASAYANLEDTTSRHAIDLAALSRSARSELSAAGSGRSSRNALERLVAAFHDPHLRLEGPPSWLSRTFSGGSGDAPIEPGISGVEAASRMGFTDDAGGFEIDFDDDPSFEEVSDWSDARPFACCVLRIGERRVGVLRIAEFGVDRYLSVAAAAVVADETVLERGERAVWIAAEQALIDHLSARVRELAARGISALVVDVTGNGGGTDWADPAARVLTGTPLSGAPVSLVRHAHHEASIQAAITATSGVLRRSDIETDEEAIVRDALDRLQIALHEVQDRGDRSGVFRGEEPLVPFLSRGALFATGPIAYLSPGALDGVPGRESLFSPLRYRYEEGIWLGPLVVLVDEQTASASELFVAMLRDHGACQVVGRRTLGAGAGYTNGGIDCTLPRSGLRLRAPDIIRHRQDGTNELFGIAPDVEIDEDADRDDPEVWTAAIARALEAGS